MADMTDNEFTDVSVLDPSTHETSDEKYTSYLIHLKTSNVAFNLAESQVRRRYSEFLWLRSHLTKRFCDVKMPPLPTKTLFSSKFNDDVISSRMSGLQKFLKQVVDTPIYLSDSSLHMFLQTPLSLDVISRCVSGQADLGVMDMILQHGQTSIPDARLDYENSNANSSCWPHNSESHPHLVINGSNSSDKFTVFSPTSQDALPTSADHDDSIKSDLDSSNSEKN